MKVDKECGGEIGRRGTSIHAGFRAVPGNHLLTHYSAHYSSAGWTTFASREFLLAKYPLDGNPSSSPGAGVFLGVFV